MFYAHFVLSKKGPLAKIWLAAHWDKKLTKAHVFETSIEGSVEAIIQPKAKIALRTSGHLLLGVVRIYSRKAKYLLADCNEAFVKIKMAFRPGMVDLPEENREAAVSAITLPEAFHDFDTAMAELGELEVPSQFAMNQSRPEEITMKEDLGTIAMLNDDGFGDAGFDGGLLDDSQLDDSLLFSKEPSDFATLAMMAMKENKERWMDEDAKKKEIEDNINRFSSVGVEHDGDGGGGGDARMASLTEAGANGFAVGSAAAGGDDDDLDDYAGPAGMGDDDDDYDSNDGGRDSPAGDGELFTDHYGMEEGGERESGGLFEDPMVMPGEESQDKVNNHHNNNHNNNRNDKNNNNRDEEMLNNFSEAFSPSLHQPPATPATVSNLLLDPSMPQLEQESPINDYPLASPMQPTQHESETFVLKPVDVVSNAAGNEIKKYRKKRKLVVDEQKAIASETMKLQLCDTSDIVSSLDLAPPTKKLMLWKETGGVEKLTAHPGRCLVSKRLIKIISANLVLHQTAEKMPPLDTTTSSSPADHHHRLHDRSEELEVRSKIGADGNPRLVFALKKKPLASPESLSSIASPHYTPSSTPSYTPFSTPSSTPLKHPHNGHQSLDESSNHTAANNDDNYNDDHLVDDDNNNDNNKHKNSVRKDKQPYNNNNNNNNDNTLLNDSNKPLNNNNNNNNNLDEDDAHNNSGSLEDKWLEATNKLKDSRLSHNNTTNNDNNNDPNNTLKLPPEINHHYNNYDDDDDDNADAGCDDDDDDYGSHNVSTEHANDDVVEEEEEEEEEDEELVEPTGDEALEELEEKRWNKRSHQMLSSLNKLLTKRDSVSFKETIARCNRKQVASKFYSLLVLKKTQTIEVRQVEPYSDILLSRGALYAQP